MNKTLVIASVLMAAALTGIFSTTTAAVYADESETNTEQSIKQKNVGDDGSSQFNCGQNNIDSEEAEDGLLSIDVDACGTLSVEALAD
jgi:outer membrane lipoprotein SlyB